MKLPIYTTIVLLVSAISNVHGASPRSEVQNQKQTLEPKIAWYGQLKDGLAEAKRSGRPILLVSAAPQCQNVSGMW